MTNQNSSFLQNNNPYGLARTAAQQRVTDKIVLAVDLDETVFSYIGELKKFVQDKYDRTLQGQLQTYALDQEGWFDSRDEFLKIHGEAVEDGIYSRLTPYDNASEVLWDLARSGYQVNYVTARFVNTGQHAKVVTDTAQSLETNSLPHSNLLFLHQKTNFMADAYIDDAAHNIEVLQNLDRNTIIFDQEYNQELTGARATNWLEVREILRNQFGK